MSSGGAGVTIIADWAGYPTDREMDGYYWVPDQFGQPVIAEWRAREEYWLLTIHSKYMEASVEVLLPAAAAKLWVYVLPCPPPPEVAP